MQVLFTPAARADYEDAVRWYAAYAPEMVQAFRQAIRSTLSRISESPHQFPSGPYTKSRR
ncbi:type II toxin-antitoxin system RelE/ParE family toxin [Rhizobium oryzicola]|uniref:type II toxin-antitoxin system RelE/ParE family toxin n=1 Tax=Rhizobium oryzicola TaxID=1232668 RepID=UPI00345B9D24